MIQTLQFTLNGKPVRIDVDGERTLLWVLRTDLGLTGVSCSPNNNARKSLDLRALLFGERENATGVF